MRPSSGNVWTLLALAALWLTAEAQSRQRIHIRTHRTNYRIDTWDDGRDEQYRMTYWKFGLKSVYTFDAGGHVRTLTARHTLYTFDLDVPSRMLMDSTDDALEEVETDLAPVIDCATCETTWNTMCDVGLTEVCFLYENSPAEFDNDAENSVRRFCRGVGAACARTASDVCIGQCVGDACNPNPCQNLGACSLDPAGGRICSCATGFGGMDCQTDTSTLAPFFIELEYIGTWTQARRDVFQSAADRWSEVITHVPCGGSPTYPAGRLFINSTLDEIDGAGGDEGNVLGFAGPTAILGSCPTVSLTGVMTFDIFDIDALEESGGLEGVVLHEMGHVIGVGTLWGEGFGGCSTCLTNGSPTWTCPAAVSTYADIGGSDADIVQNDSVGGSSCGHLDETIFDDELMTPFVNDIMFLSKITAATLDDLKYVVDPSAPDAYALPSMSGTPIEAGPGSSMAISDTAVKAMILVADSNGDIIEEKPGVVMQF